MRTAAAAMAIELTEQEKALLARIDFEPDNHDAWPAIAAAMEELTKLLIARNAIPEHRLRYVDDAAYNVGGRGSSRYQIIERNGRPTPVLRNPAFLKHLRYFLYGPDLPQSVIEAFRQKVIACGEPFTGSDALTVADYARQLTRSRGLDTVKAPKEFYKLALDCGLDADDARVVRDSVMKVRR
jgi:hypothetical protein